MSNFSSTSASKGSSSDSLISIGDVLSRLRDEFPDISISKIRFLESSGLVTPARTSSGYRKFSLVDLEHLRYILRVQRDHFLPLRVIREHIDAMNRGLEPPSLSDVAPTVPRTLLSTDTIETHSTKQNVFLTKEELIKQCGITEETFNEFVQFGLLRSNNDLFDSGAIRIASVCSELAGFGLEARHLRAVVSAAAREVDLFAPIVKAARSAKDGGSLAAAQETSLQLSGLITNLHESLVRSIADSELN